jgi:chromosome segregation ATPase
MGATPNQLAEQLAEHLRAIVHSEQKPIEERLHSLGALVAKIDQRIDRDYGEERQSVTATLAEHKRRIDSIVDTVSARLRALEGTGAGTASPAHVNVVQLHNAIESIRQVDKNGDEALWTRCDNIERRIDAFESEASRLNELDARVDALGARVENLWAERGPRVQASHGGSVVVSVGRMGPPPGVPAIVLARCAPHGKSDCPECGAYAVVDPTAQAYERIVQERNGYRDGQAAILKARDIALKACDEANARITILQRELKAANERTAQLDELLADADKARHKAEMSRDEARREVNTERGKRMAAESSCTQFRGRVLEIEAQLKAKDVLLEAVSMHATEVPTLREKLAEAKAQVERMTPLVETVERWSHSRGAGVGLSYSGPAQYAASGADAGLLEKLAEYKKACEPEGDCQDGTCDCPMRPGTYGDIVHTDDCPNKDDPSEMPF